MADKTYALKYVRSIYVDVNIRAKDIDEAYSICNELERVPAFWELIANAAHELEANAGTELYAVDEANDPDYVSLTPDDVKRMLGKE